MEILTHNETEIYLGKLTILWHKIINEIIVFLHISKGNLEKYIQLPCININHLKANKNCVSI